MDELHSDANVPSGAGAGLFIDRPRDGFGSSYNVRRRGLSHSGQRVAVECGDGDIYCRLGGR